MKKTLVLATALVAIFSMLCVSALAALEPSEIIGQWYLNSIVMGDTPINPADFGMDMTMVLSEDNTVRMQMAGEEDQAGTWAIVDGQAVLSVGESDDDLIFTLADGILTAEQEDMMMVFGREKEETETIEIAPVRVDAALADFDGAWNAYLGDVDGIKLPVAAFGFDVSLAIDGGKVTVTAFGADQQLVGDVSAGVLTTTGEDSGDEPISMSFFLHEDGTLSCTFEETVTFYFLK